MIAKKTSNRLRRQGVAPACVAKQVAKLDATVLPLLEAPGELATSACESRGPSATAAVDHLPDAGMSFSICPQRVNALADALPTLRSSSSRGP